LNTVGNYARINTERPTCQMKYVTSVEQRIILNKIPRPDTRDECLKADKHKQRTTT